MRWNYTSEQSDKVCIIVVIAIMEVSLNKIVVCINTKNNDNAALHKSQLFE